MSLRSRIFQKPALSLKEQLDLLQQRGLVTPEPDRVLHYLQFIGYYRLSGYFLPFQDPLSLSFRKNTSFDQLLNVYIFDRQLRLLVMDAIERIEVAVRATISNCMSEAHGPHWYLNTDLFVEHYNHPQLIQLVKQATGFNNTGKQTEFSQHYFKNYHQPSLPPSWMVAEVLSIGIWSNIYKNIKSRALQKDISRPYDLHYSVMSSWLHTFTYLRNLCAHHSRLWNRTFTIKPKILKRHREHFVNNASLYAQVSVLNVFLAVIADGSRWQKRLFDLLDNNKHIAIEQMGFSANWSEDPFWRLK